MAVEQHVRVRRPRAVPVRVDNPADVVGRELLGKVGHLRLVSGILEQGDVHGVEADGAKHLALDEEVLGQEDDGDGVGVGQDGEEIAVR